MLTHRLPENREYNQSYCASIMNLTIAKMKPRCFLALGESSVDSAVPAPDTGYSPPALRTSLVQHAQRHRTLTYPKPAMPLLMVSIQKRPLSLFPCDTAVMIIPTDRNNVVKTAPDFLPNLSEMKPNASIPRIFASSLVAL